MVGDVDFGAAPAGFRPRRAACPPRGAGGCAADLGTAPGTRGEAEAVTDLFTRHHLGRPAAAPGSKEAAVRERAPAGRFIHQATHGFFAPLGVPASGATEDGGQGRAPGGRPAAAVLLGRLHPLRRLALAGRWEGRRLRQSALPYPGRRTIRCSRRFRRDARKTRKASGGFNLLMLWTIVCQRCLPCPHPGRVRLAPRPAGVGRVEASAASRARGRGVSRVPRDPGRRSIGSRVCHAATWSAGAAPRRSEPRPGGVPMFTLWRRAAAALALGVFLTAAARAAAPRNLL